MSELRTEGGRQLTLGKAVSRVDVAVVDIHDVHTLVTHEVPFMPIALQGEHGSHLQASALSKDRTLPPTPTALCLSSVVCPLAEGLVAIK